MKNFKTFAFRINVFSVLLLLFIVVASCNNSSSNKMVAEKNESTTEMKRQENEREFVRVLQKHLDAVTNRDLVALKETMAPTGQMQLILPKTEIIDGVDGFMEYHKEWFADTDWTFETKILNTEIGPDVGMASTEIVYREPKSKANSYVNRMIVSYDLRKIDGKWYIIKDHASSIEKYTDQNNKLETIKMITEQDRKFIKRAIELSEQGMDSNTGGPFGAIVVKNGEIIAEGFNAVTSSNDPTAHAEVVAIRKACEKLGSFQLDDCIIYTSCEPCPMCLGAIYWARPKAVYYACTKEDAAEIGFDDHFIYDEIDKKIEDRNVKFINLDREEGRKIFKKWENKEGRVDY